MEYRDRRSPEAEQLLSETEFQKEELFSLIKCYKLRIRQLEKERRQLSRQLDRYEDYIKYQKQYVNQIENQQRQNQLLPVSPPSNETQFTIPGKWLHWLLIILIFNYAIYLFS